MPIFGKPLVRNYFTSFLSSSTVMFCLGRFEEISSELFKLKDRNYHTYILSPVGIYNTLYIIINGELTDIDADQHYQMYNYYIISLHFNKTA